MKIKKIQWKSKKQKNRVIKLMIFAIIGIPILSLWIFNTIRINRSWRLTYENHPSIQAITYDEAVNFYTAQGYICEIEKGKYTNGTFCNYPDDVQYPNIVIQSKKTPDLLLIHIENEISTVQESDIAFALFIDMSSDVLDLSAEDKEILTEWVNTTLEENTSSIFWEIKGFNGETFQVGIYKESVDIEIGSQIRY